MSEDLFGSAPSQNPPDRYGIPYVGSKSKIAREIVDILPSADCFVDLFAGGCAITHAAMLSCKWRRYIANDIGDTVELFRDCIAGKYKDEARVVSREQFFAEKDRDAIIRLLWSFGNNGDSYLWGEDIEPVKLAACRMLTAETLKERRLAYMEFVKRLQRLESLERLQRLESLERLQSLESLERLQSLETSRKSYDEVVIPDDVTVYCDPPYYGTDDVNAVAYGEAFDHERFFGWLRKINRPVYVSNYTMPDDFVTIWQKKKQCTLSASGNFERTERLYLHERWVKK